MQKWGYMPSTTELSTNAGLTPETVYKHLRAFKEHDLYKQEYNKYRLLVKNVLNTIYNLGMQGNIKALKVYLDYFPPEATVASTNNIITTKDNTHSLLRGNSLVRLIEQNNIIQIIIYK